jgi:hypothetical protein
MFSAPTAARVLKKQDESYLTKYDLSSLKALFLAGEPLDEPTALSLRYIDPELALVPVDGVGLAFADGPARTEPDVGDIFANRLGLFLKIRDDAHSQRLFAYVDVRSGLIRARMERGIERLLRWRVQRF